MEIQIVNPELMNQKQEDMEVSVGSLPYKEILRIMDESGFKRTQMQRCRCVKTRHCMSTSNTLGKQTTCMFYKVRAHLLYVFMKSFFFLNAVHYAPSVPNAYFLS